MLGTHRYEQVRNLSLILLPRLAILVPTFVNISNRAMDDHGGEEDGVEPRERRPQPRHCSPRQGEEEIARVVYFAGVTVCKALVLEGKMRSRTVLTKSVRKHGAPVFCPDNLGIFHRLPRHLWEGLARGSAARLFRPESIFLAVGRVPHPIDEEIRHVQRAQSVFVPCVGAGMVVCQVDRAVNVRQRHAGQIPEYQHEAPFLVVHVPGRHDEFFAFAARVRVQPVRHQQQTDFSRNIAIVLVLPGSGSQRYQEQYVPGKSDLAEHLEVDQAEHPGVELRAHEEIVHEVAGHTVLLAAVDGRNVCYDRHPETRNNGDRHERTELVDNIVQLEQTGEMQTQRHDDRRPPRPHGATIVVQPQPILVRQGLALGPDPRHQTVASTFEDGERPIHGPGFRRRPCAVVYHLGHAIEELSKRLPIHRPGKLAVVVSCSNPHVVHQSWEADHCRRHAPRASKLEMAGAVDFWVHARAPAVHHLGQRDLVFGV